MIMFTINKALLPGKGHYFSFFGASAGVVPFIARIALQFGASPSVVGYIYASLPFIVLIGKGIFGVLADKYQQKKCLLIGSVVLMTSAFFVIDFIPSVWGNGTLKTFNATLRCNNESSLVWCLPPDTVARSSTPTSNSSCTCRSADPLINNLNNIDKVHFDSINLTNNQLTFQIPIAVSFNDTLDNCNIVDFEQENSIRLCVDGGHQFTCDIFCSAHDYNLNETEQNKSGTINSKVVSLWFCLSLAYLGMGVAVSLADTLILEILDVKEVFGRERLWGAVGWGSLSLITGLLIDWFSQSDEYLSFTPGMYVVLIMGTLDVVIIALYLKVVKTEKPKRMFKSFGNVFLNPEVLVFTLGVFIVGCLTSVLWTFLIIYLNELGASQFLIGLTMAVQCFLGEIPFFFISNWFLRKLGHNHSLTLVLAMFSFRLICYSLIENPWLVLPIELTQGITYSIFFTALATYGNTIAHASIHSTVQGVLQGMFEGFGVGVGALVSGVAYEYFGAKTFFLYTGILAEGFAITIGLVQCYLLRVRRARESRLVSESKCVEVKENDVEMPMMAHNGLLDPKD